MPDDLGVGVLRHHTDELLPISIGHPVLGLDRLACRDPRLELGDRVRARHGIVSCKLPLSGPLTRQLRAARPPGRRVASPLQKLPLSRPMVRQVHCSTSQRMCRRYPNSTGWRPPPLDRRRTRRRGAQDGSRHSASPATRAGASPGCVLCITPGRSQCRRRLALEDALARSAFVSGAIAAACRRTSVRIVYTATGSSFWLVTSTSQATTPCGICPSRSSLSRLLLAREPHPDRVADVHRLHEPQALETVVRQHWPRRRVDEQPAAADRTK